MIGVPYVFIAWRETNDNNNETKSCIFSRLYVFLFQQNYEYQTVVEYTLMWLMQFAEH